MVDQKTVTRSDSLSNLVDQLNNIADRDKGLTGDFIINRWNGTAYSYDVDNPSGNHFNFGTGIMTVQDAAVTVGPYLKLSDGDAANPILTFTLDTNTGVCRVGNDQGGLSAGGSLVAQWQKAGSDLQFLTVDGSVSLPGQAFISDTNTGAYRVGADAAALVAGGAVVLQWKNASGGLTCILGSTTASTHMTTGLLVQQGAATDEAIALKSSTVAHGMTTPADTDTYGTLGLADTTLGGLKVRGYGEDKGGLYLAGSCTTANTTKSTSARAPIELEGGLKSGTAAGAMSADGNLVTIINSTNVRFIFDGDGDSHQDAGRDLRKADGSASDPGTGWTNYDSVDDLRALNALAIALAPEDDPLRQQFLDALDAQRAVLDAIPGKPLVTWNDETDGHRFVNMSRLTMLLTGAVRQLGARVETLERRALEAGDA